MFLKFLLSILLAAPHINPQLIGFALATTENRIQISIVDTGINLTPALAPYLCSEGHKDLTGRGLQDTVGHGTTMAFLIAQSISPATHCLVIIKWLDYGDEGPINRFSDGLIQAAYSKAKYMNVSAGGRGFSRLEDMALRYAVDQGMRVIVAAGNDGLDLNKDCSIYPACFMTESPNFYTVGALSPNGERAEFSNYGDIVDMWELGIIEGVDGALMFGTSPATAVATGKIAAREYKDGAVK